MYCAAEVIFYENFEKGLKTDPCEKSRPNTDIQWSIQSVGDKNLQANLVQENQSGKRYSKKSLIMKRQLGKLLVRKSFIQRRFYSLKYLRTYPYSLYQEVLLYQKLYLCMYTYNVINVSSSAQQIPRWKPEEHKEQRRRQKYLKMTKNQLPDYWREDREQGYSIHSLGVLLNRLVDCFTSCCFLSL